MKRVLCVVLAIACGVIAFVKVGGDWRTVAGPVVRLVVDDPVEDYLTGGSGVPVAIDDRYQIIFPVEPEREVDQTEGLVRDAGVKEVVSYYAGGHTLEYLVQYFDVPAFGSLDKAGRETLMKQIAMSNQGFFQGTLLNWTPRPERSTLEFTLRHPEGSYLRTTVRVEGERIYFFAVGDDRNPPRTFERFTYSATPLEAPPG